MYNIFIALQLTFFLNLQASGEREKTEDWNEKNKNFRNMDNTKIFFFIFWFEQNMNNTRNTFCFIYFFGSNPKRGQD